MADEGLEAALEKLHRLKAEHAPLLAMITGDPGMQPRTRQALVDHIHEEEDEHMARIRAALVGDEQTAESVVSAHASRGSGLTVGSLRPPSTGSPTQLGSLRPERPTPTEGSVGSLR